uniref:C4-type zinc ribbon domain-containing protein n=1 Tax=candidate division WOR-3 bacterium TaxID=2052148 RepID=A0A7V3ZVV3_UNCW3
MNKQLEYLRALEEFDSILKDFEEKEYQKLGFLNEPINIDFMKIVERERTKLRKKIAANLLKEYDRIKKHYGSKIVVQVIKGYCSGCYSKLPSEIVSRCKTEVKTCPNCGRFLYYLT